MSKADIRTLSERYILVGTAPQRCPDPTTWLQWFESADRHVAVTSIEHRGVMVTVVSQFLGVDDSLVPSAHPSLFETRIFGGPLDHNTWRVGTWSKTLQVHAAAVQKVMRALALDMCDVA